MMIFFAVTGVVFVLVATLIAIESERAMRTYPGYAMLPVSEPEMTPERFESLRQEVLALFRDYDTAPEPVRRLAWDIMTSRGDQKHIYGPMPSAAKQAEGE